MLPDIRAVIAALVAAVGLLMVSFALVATFRVAQESRATTLQAAFAERTRAPLFDRTLASPSTGGVQRAVMIIETPGPHLAPRPPALDPPISVKAVPVAESAPDPLPVARVEASPIAPILAASPEADPAADLPMGGPLAEPPAGKPDLPRVAAVDAAERELAKKIAEQKTAEKKAAAEKARKARAARIARQRKAAARRAAQARAAKQKANPFGNTQFGSNTTFGGTFTTGQ
jgi:hypothetical protein